MAEEEAAEVEASSEGGSGGYALMTDAWPTCVKVSLPNNMGAGGTTRSVFFSHSMQSVSIADGRLTTVLQNAQVHLDFGRPPPQQLQRHEGTE